MWAQVECKRAQKQQRMEEKHVADYFIISGISENPNELSLESKPLISSVLPITDVTVIFKGLGEQCPIGYTCIETTPGGHLADLNNGNFKSQNIQICYRRGNDKPPLVDVGVFYEDKDRVLTDVEVVYTTPYGRSASTGYSGSKSGTYITYRRAKTNTPYNQLVVVDLCVILNNKSEHPPHAFYSIKKNLNKSIYGMIGSEVFLCYKKTLLSPKSLSFTPHIISRFPLQDYANFPLPDTVPLFCLPAGANIELRPTNVPLPRPTASTFVLTSDSAQKIYGSALSFYEPFDESLLTEDQKSRLGLVTRPASEDDPNHDDDDNSNDHDISGHNNQATFAIKSICILSRWPFFVCFEKFMQFLHKLVFNPNYCTNNPVSPTHKSNVPLEHHISHFLLDVSFPTPQRPTVLVQLMPGTDETLTISQPSSRLPVPLTGASFIQFLTLLGVENTMNVLLFGLCEQKILLHSLHPWLLTGVAEAITAMLFPFHWQCPYVPLCPLSLHGILNAPLPYIVGIDSRCFDTFTPPDDVICIDLDTKSIFLSELKKCMNPRILPKRAARVLRNSLEKIFNKWMRISQAIGSNQSPQHHRTPSMDASRQQLEKKFELEIQEAFVRFMATILRGFRTYLLPITSAPTIGATDPTSLFNFEDFLMSRDRSYSQFYQLITKTQMFTHYIEERSFVSDKDTSLAFFDDCEEKLISSDDMFSDKPIKLFDIDDSVVQTDRSVYIPAPEQSPSVSANNSLVESSMAANLQQNQARKNARRLMKFGPLNPALFHRHPQIQNFPSLDKAFSNSNSFENRLFSENIANEPNSSISISRRTKQEVKASQKMAKRAKDTPLDWAKYLVSCSYCLWFATLPSYIAYCKSINRDEQSNNPEAASKSTARILRNGYSTIVRMQKLELVTDEICFRVLALLCGHYGQPALAVRIFFEMKKSGIKPNAVTYGYYNKAVLESKWPDHSSKPTTVLWTKIRNVISGIALFKSHGRMAMERRNRRSIQLIGDPSFYSAHADVHDRSECSNRLFKPTTMPINSAKEHANFNQHRRSLVNRSFSTYQKSTLDITDSTDPMGAINTNQAKNSIHKSYSMHLRDGSPDRGSLVRLKSSSLEDEDPEEPLIEPYRHPVNYATSETQARKVPTSAHDLFLTLKERNQLLTDLEDENQVIASVDLVDNSAGLLFTTNSESCRRICRSASKSPVQFDASMGAATTTLIERQKSHLISANNNQAGCFLLDPNLASPNHHGGETNTLLDPDNFGEDAQILKKLEARGEQRPNFEDSVDFLGVSSLEGDGGADERDDEDARSTRMSISTTESEQNNEEELSMLKNITSTPNFKLASLINDASNLQWSKWTSSQNSKSVYKGIKSAATGIVSSLQEIKSSFSISNSATPSKLLTSAHHKSTATREMLSQWANFYFSSQPTRADDDDSDSLSFGSNDLLSNDEDVEPSAAEGNDFRCCHKLFVALENHYNNSSSKEDLVDHATSEDEVDKDELAIEVKMTTCSRCNVCHSLLYDEEIMVRWSHNESDLNARCVYCRAKMVPLMSILIDDLRFKHSKKVVLNNNKADGTDGITDNLLDLSFDDNPNNQRDSNNSPGGGGGGGGGSDTDDLIGDGQSYQQSFTVPYLSPIVLRKELESCFESSGDNCPASGRFVDEHPIIYWNLLWYFSRINVPTHLALLCLNSKSILNGRDVPDHIRQKLNKVIVKILWDNETLHSEMGKPLYRLLERGDPSLQVRAILCDELHFTSNFLDRVINLIKSNELQKAMNLVLNARLKSSARFSFDKNRHNLYRDLIFLINMKLGPGKLFMGKF